MDLNDFYLNKVWALPADQRYKPINVIDDVVVVNFDPLFNRDYGLRAVDQLIYLAHKFGKNKQFLFTFDDGTNPQLSGAIEVIKNIQTTFNLTNKTCAVISRETLDIPNVRSIKHDSILMWIRTLYPTIKDIEIPDGSFSRRFAVWFNRGTFYRTIVAKHLHQNYQSDSYISYQEPGMLHDSYFSEYFVEELTWAQANAPVVYDQLFPNRQYDHNMIVGASRKPYEDYFAEIVVETDCVSTAWITEKVVKNLYIGKPFILMGAPHSLAKLQARGFKTFSNIIDESYDNISNNHYRLEAVLTEIDKLATQDVGELHKQILPILSHNRKVYERLVGR